MNIDSIENSHLILFNIGVISQIRRFGKLVYYTH